MRDFVVSSPLLQPTQPMMKTKNGCRPRQFVPTLDIRGELLEMMRGSVVLEQGEMEYWFRLVIDVADRINEELRRECIVDDAEVRVSRTGESVAVDAPIRPPSEPRFR